MIDRRFVAALVGVVLLLVACSPGPGSGGRLEGTEWILRSMATDGELVLVEDQAYADAHFDARRIEGWSGCNTYDARYRSGTRSLFVSPPAVTLMACAEEAMAFEQTYLANLQASRFFTANRSTLTIFAAGGETLLVFDAAPRNPLLGPWVVQEFDNDGTVGAPLEGTTLDLAFGLTGVNGFAGCNRFDGTYGTNGNAVRIGRLATTRMACEEPIMAQEAAFLDALQGVAFLDQREADAITLTDRGGSIAIALRRPEPAASPSAAPSEAPSEEPSEEPSEAPSPTASPTPTPTEAPTPSPSPSPTAAPTAVPTAAPPIVPNPSSCDLVDQERTLATIAYPSTWSTITEPVEGVPAEQLVCRYFDRQPITVPDDPTTVTAPVTIDVIYVPYAEAVTVATDGSAWQVTDTVEVDADGHAATMVAATATAEAAGIPVGSSRVAYFVDAGEVGTIVLSTVGAADDPDLARNAAVLTLMVEASTFGPPS